MDKKLLSILCCPVSHKGLSLARGDVLESINKAIGDGVLTNRDGVTLESALKEALITDDGKLMYPVNDGIPVLLEGESVSLDQLEAAPPVLVQALQVEPSLEKCISATPDPASLADRVSVAAVELV